MSSDAIAIVAFVGLVVAAALIAWWGRRKAISQPEVAKKSESVDRDTYTPPPMDGVLLRRPREPYSTAPRQSALKAAKSYKWECDIAYHEDLRIRSIDLRCQVIYVDHMIARVFILPDKTMRDLWINQIRSIEILAMTDEACRKHRVSE